MPKFKAYVVYMWKAFINLLFPRTCILCDTLLLPEETVACLACVHTLPGLELPAEQRALQQTFAGRLPVQHAWAWLHFRKGSVVQRLLHEAKYGGRPEIARWCGMHMGRRWKEQGALPALDLVLPVPLHPRRLKERGFNQSEEIARGLCSVTGWELHSDNLVRSVYARSNTRRNRWARMQQMQNSFSLLRPAELEGKHILLLDDVLTTGATMEACAGQLCSASLQSFNVAALARTL